MSQDKDGWTLFEPSYQDDNFVIVPNNDSRMHEQQGTQCWCEPRIKLENGKRLVVHYAKDKRS